MDRLGRSLREMLDTAHNNMRLFHSLGLARSLFGECGVGRGWRRIGAQGLRRSIGRRLGEQLRRRSRAWLRASGAEGNQQALIQASVLLTHALGQARRRARSFARPS